MLNPALIIIEVPLNAYVLWVNRASLPAVWRRVLPIIIGLVPGSSSARCMVSRVSPDWLKLYTFIVLLPLILLQAAGFSRPIKAERAPACAFGAGRRRAVFGDDDFGSAAGHRPQQPGAREAEFRAALGLVRLAESSMTAVAYVYAGLFTAASSRRSCPGSFRAWRLACRSARDHPSDAAGNVPPHLHELRRLGGGLRSVEAAARSAPGRGQCGLSRPGGRRRARHVAAVSVLLTPSPDSERRCASERQRVGREVRGVAAIVVDGE